MKASLGVLAGVLIAGTLGFYLLGDSRRVLESVYLTVMIVTTVGLKDQYRASMVLKAPGRWWSCWWEWRRHSMRLEIWLLF